jgi:hypothetical protein
LGEEITRKKEEEGKMKVCELRGTEHSKEEGIALLCCRETKASRVLEHEARKGVFTHPSKNNICPERLIRSSKSMELTFEIFNLLFPAILHQRLLNIPKIIGCYAPCPRILLMLAVKRL